MTEPADTGSTSASPTGFAFHMEPQLQESDGRWTARYPEADWSVSGSSEDEARNQLREEFIRRQNAGEDVLAYADDVYVRHLQEPIPGVYAMNNELYRELLMAATAEADVHRAFTEAEQKRLAGESYTMADYLRGGH